MLREFVGPQISVRVFLVDPVFVHNMEVSDSRGKKKKKRYLLKSKRSERPKFSMTVSIVGPVQAGITVPLGKAAGEGLGSYFTVRVLKKEREFDEDNMRLPA
jgi:hypothetical protein